MSCRKCEPDDYYMTGRAERITQLESLLIEMTSDELMLMLMRARKLMGEGRKEYGPLDMASDKRSISDFVREAHDEGVDSGLYLDMAMIAIRRGAK